ncbi:MAG: 2-amino-4-hydroxy-6-hydroxymethyldihydropteridine diphosphokinase [Planctomycetota bacterium]
MPVCLFAIGSNLGDREQTLARAVAAVKGRDSIRVVRQSRWFSSDPVGGPQGQGPFLNGALLVETEIPPQALLQELRAVEDSCGRQRAQRWGARTLDLDLLLYGDLVIDEPGLRVPHPRMTFRPFVMAPAVEVAGGMRHPKLEATLQAIDQTRQAGADAVRVAGSRERREEVAAHVAWLAGTSRVGREAERERDDETLVWLAGARCAGPLRPKLQVLADPRANPLPATPTVWLHEAPASDHAAELAAAVACVWPGLG